MQEAKSTENPGSLASSPEESWLLLIIIPDSKQWELRLTTSPSSKPSLDLYYIDAARKPKLYRGLYITASRAPALTEQMAAGRMTEGLVKLLENMGEGDSITRIRAVLNKKKDEPGVRIAVSIVTAPPTLLASRRTPSSATVAARGAGVPAPAPVLAQAPGAAAAIDASAHEGEGARSAQPAPSS